MPTVPVESTFDLTFIGAGISCAYTLQAVLAELRANPPSRPIQMAIIEPGPDCFGGLAYGRRSGGTARVITPLSEFLSPPERDRFVEWLQGHMVEAFDDFETTAGPRSRAWLDAHRADIVAGTCNDLYLPRSLFGHYVEATTNEAISAAVDDGLVDLRVIRAAATGLTEVVDGFEVMTDGDGSLRSRRVVLSVGTPRAGRLFDDLDRGGDCESGPALMIETPYSPDLAATIGRIADHVHRIADRSPKIVIVGANATMLDVLYQLEDHPGVAATQPTYCVISHRGVFPARLESPEPRPTDLPNLDRLSGRTQLRAADIHDAVVADLIHHGCPPQDGGWLIPAIGRAIGSLAAELPPAEQQIFATSTGNEIGRLQRRAGIDYYQVVDSLDAAHRIVRRQGSFDDHLVHLEGDCSFDVIVNASGSAGLVPGSSPLLDSIIESGTATVTEAKTGVVVDERYEAAPGLFVMGPLLAGNVLAGRPIWHLEQAGRIISMSATLGRHIGQSFH